MKPLHHPAPSTPACLLGVLLTKAVGCVCIVKFTSVATATIATTVITDQMPHQPPSSGTIVYPFYIPPTPPHRAPPPSTLRHPNHWRHRLRLRRQHHTVSNTQTGTTTIAANAPHTPATFREACGLSGASIAATPPPGNTSRHPDRQRRQPCHEHRPAHTCNFTATAPPRQRRLPGLRQAFATAHWTFHLSPAPPSSTATGFNASAVHGREYGVYPWPAAGKAHPAAVFYDVSLYPPPTNHPP